jgi:hypothetical protein
MQLRLANLLGLAPVRPVLHRFLCGNKMVNNTPKHEFWVKRSGLGAFVAKICDATSFSELARFATSSACFASIFVPKQNGPKHTTTCVLGQMD